MKSDFPPFRILDNLYYAGSRKYSCHLLDTGDGLILIDTGYAEDADRVIESVNLLGFRIKDVKIILHSHGHLDHTGASVKIARMSGAKTFLSKKDQRCVPFVPDFDIRDGDVIRLGNTAIECVASPGHTAGTMSFFFDVRAEDGRVLRAGMFGGAGVNQLRSGYLRDRGISPFMRAEFYSSLEMLKKYHVDVMLGNHPYHAGTFEKYQRLRAGCRENPFIDPERWGNFLDETQRKTDEMLLSESRANFVNYAHRGASAACPENTFLSFNTGIFMGANGIETDVRRAKDGTLVLFHDDTMERTCHVIGSISDYTVEMTKQLRVRGGSMGLEDRICTLRDFLDHFAYRYLYLAVELKEKGVAEETADLLREYNRKNMTVVTSFDLEELCAFKRYAPEFRCGYLTKDTGDEMLSRLMENGIEEYCPHAGNVTEENVLKWHRLGFNVRAWGVGNEEIMKKCVDSHCDGMTVNFPDRLQKYLEEKAESGAAKASPMK